MAVVELHDVVLLGVVSLVHAWQFGTFLIICNRFFISTPDMRQSKTLLTIDESCARNSVFDSIAICHMAIENSVSSYF